MAYSFEQPGRCARPGKAGLRGQSGLGAEEPDEGGERYALSGLQVTTQARQAVAGPRAQGGIGTPGQFGGFGRAAALEVSQNDRLALLRGETGQRCIEFRAEFRRLKSALSTSFVAFRIHGVAPFPGGAAVRGV